MSSDILFDNLIIVDDETLARDWAAQTYDLKRKLIDREAVSKTHLEYTYFTPYTMGLKHILEGQK